MSQQNEIGIKTFTAGEDLEAFRRVKLSSGSGSEVVYADGGDTAIGITQEKVSDGDQVSVALISSGRTFKVTAAEALSAGAALYQTEDGKVQDTSTGTSIGKALEAASADGAIIEYLPA